MTTNKELQEWLKQWPDGAEIYAPNEVTKFYKSSLRYEPLDLGECEHYGEVTDGIIYIG